MAAAKPQITEKTGVRTLAAVSEPSAIARGSVFVVAGKDLGPVDELKADVPYGQDLGGVSVAFTTMDDSAVVPAYIVSASATRVVAILPSSASAGDYKVTVTFNGEASDPFAAKVADRNFGILTVDGQVGSGAVAKIRVPDSDSMTAGFTQPLRPSQTVDLEAAGLGSIDTPDNEFPPELNAVDGALVVLGGVEIPVTYIGRNPLKPGYNRVTFVVPAEGLPAGCTIDIRIKIGDVVTAKGSIPVVASADAPACVHPLGLTPEGLKTLDAGGTITLGGFSLLQQSIKITIPDFGTLETKTESIGGSFVRYNAASLAQYMGTTGASWIVNPVGCNIWTAVDSTSPAIAAELVDAGELNIKGPGGLDRVVPKVANTNSYLLDLAPAGGGIPGIPTIPGLPPIPGLPGGGGATASGVQKGTYTLSGKGGAVVGAFSVASNVPDSIVWTNREETSMNTVDRGADLSFLWTGDGNAGDLATAVGLSRGPAPEDTTKIVTRTFMCFAPTTAHTIVVPSSILQQMPANPGDNPELVGQLILQHTNGTNIPRLVAPLVDGGNTEPGTFGFAYGAMKQASFK
jgi:uncharacterized protein (TIGR03437 family)